MKKRMLGVFIIVLLAAPLVLADHGFWNEVKDFFGREEKVVGEAG